MRPAGLVWPCLTQTNRQLQSSCATQMPKSVIYAVITRRQTPEERELEKKQDEFAALESKLAQRELDLATLQAELRAFERRYLSIVGVKYAELDEIEAQIAEILARRTPRDPHAQERAKQARAQAEESAQTAGTARESTEKREFKPPENLKKLYREVAKRIRPDLATDDKERARRTQLMAEANRAYEDGDETRMQAILRAREAALCSQIRCHAQLTVSPPHPGTLARS